MTVYTARLPPRQHNQLCCFLGLLCEGTSSSVHVIVKSSKATLPQTVLHASNLAREFSQN